MSVENCQQITLGVAEAGGSEEAQGGEGIGAGRGIVQAL